MSDTPSSEELLKAFPEWTDREEDAWLQFFQDITQALIGARLDPESPERIRRLQHQDRYELFREDILMGAELADAAVEEMQARFSIQEAQQRNRRRRAKAAYQARRGQRLKSRK